MNGTVDSITTDWRGDTLAAAVISADTEIAVRDTSDFDEDGGWITIADAAPIEYLTVDEDFDTITLAATAGAAYETGDPVVVWDPTVLPEGAKVVEYVASVMTDRGAVPATIPHAVVPLSGVDRLLGASVSIDEEDDGDWYVAQVYGRESSIDVGFIGSPLFRAYLAVDGGRAGGVAIPTSSDTVVNDWSFVDGYDPTEFTFDDTAGRLTLHPPGEYTCVVIIKWGPNTSGRREVAVFSTTSGVDALEIEARTGPPDNGAATQVVPLLLTTTEPNVDLWVQVFQNTGSGLVLDGNAEGTFTTWRVRRDR